MTNRERFQLFNRESLVLSFIHERTLTSDEYSDVEIYDSSQLPIRLKTKCDENALQDWIERRFVPANQHRMDAMLVSFNLEIPILLTTISRALVAGILDRMGLLNLRENLINLGYSSSLCRHIYKWVEFYDNKPWLNYPTKITRGEEIL